MMKMEQAPLVAVGRTHGELIMYLGNKCGDFIWLFRSVRGKGVIRSFSYVIVPLFLINEINKFLIIQLCLSMNFVF